MTEARPETAARLPAARGRDQWVRHYMNRRRIYQGLAAGCARFPLPLLHAISRVGNTLAIAAMRRTVRALRRNMRLAIGADEATARRTARAVFHSFGYMMIDLFRARARGIVPPYLEHDHDDSALRRLPELDRGCLVVSGHIGAWELGGVYLAQHGFPVAEVGQPEIDPGIHALRSEIRSRAGVGWIEIGSSVTTALAVRAAIERGVHVALLADRAYPKDRIVVDFFGRPTPFLRSPAQLARFCRCPVVPAYILSTRDGAYRTWFDDPVLVDPGAERDAEDRRVMGEVARVLERGIREDPAQWYNFYDYWGMAGTALTSEPAR